MKIVKVWTDGSCYIKTKQGGWAYYMTCEGYEVYDHGGCSNTTISRMELRAIIEAMKKITNKEYQLEITSDSEYTINSINKGWLFQWEKEYFIGRKNEDIWKEFLVEYRKFTNPPKFIHCRGHQGILENEICDRLCDYKSFKEYKQDLKS